MKKARRSSARKQTKSARSISFSVLVGTIALLALVVLVWWGVAALGRANVQARLDRINGIYASLTLNQDAYAITNYNVFGEKRPYDYDKSRSQSSVIEYVHADTVSNTAKDLDAKIKAAGFEFIDEPYPGSAFTQYHYKSKKGEYVRLTVVSKPYFDAIRNDAIMNRSISEGGVAADRFDTNSAPSNVTIKVNLDDNNE